MDVIDVVNIVPNTLSSETNQDSEPSIAVNPENPQQIVVTAFTPAPPGGANSPIYYSTDGGLTWQLNFDMPFQPKAVSNGFPGDQTVSFAPGGSELFGAFLREDNQGLLVFRTDDITSPAVLPTFGAQAKVDQPWVDARKVVGGVDDGKFRVYIGYNDNNIGMNVATATVDVCLDALAAAPVFNPVKLNPRDGLDSATSTPSGPCPTPTAPCTSRTNAGAPARSGPTSPPTSSSRATTIGEPGRRRSRI